MTRASHIRAIHVAQSEMVASADPDVMLQTILGSCVATCLFDPVNLVGGMNHMILPDVQKNDPFGMMTQVNDMERLINELLKRGADRRQLQAKVFGGAQMIGGRHSIGATNATFVLSFLEEENIAVLGKSIGGKQARRIRFHPTTGRAQQKMVQDRPIEQPKAKAVSGGGLELFN